MLGALLGGCSTYVTPYPIGWAALNTASPDCRSVAGTYAQRGQRGPGGRSGEEDPRLTWLVTGLDLEHVVLGKRHAGDSARAT